MFSRFDTISGCDRETYRRTDKPTHSDTRRQPIPTHRNAARVKTGHTTMTAPFLKVVCHRWLRFDTAYLLAKFDDSSFSRSGDMVGAHENLNCLCDVIMLLQV